MSSPVPSHELADRSTERRRPTRRSVLLGALCVAVAGATASCQAPASASKPPVASAPAAGASMADWQAFTARFISADGRVIDTGNGGITHTEGQGYGLLFAEYFGDREMFDRLLGWTERNLRRSGDALHSWRYKPDAAVQVDDPNNATDGDLLIAWALLRAGEHWGSQDYTDLGRAIATDLLRTCVCQVGDATVLLPAADGFEHPGRVIINPSYYIFPALAAVAKAVPDPAWDAVQADGLRILRLARFGRWQLPADWLQISGKTLDAIAPAQGWPARFSWDAVRIPLHLAWSGLTAEPALAAAADFWTDQPQGAQPAWADLESDVLAGFSACAGMRAVAGVAEAARAGGAPSRPLPQVASAEDYYSASLVLLSQIALQESLASRLAS